MVLYVGSVLFILELYGISNLILKWIENFLIDRTQRVRVANSLSNVCHLLSDVSRERALKPVLFYSMKMMYVIKQNNSISMKLSTDDVKVYSDVISTTANLQLFLDSMVIWTHIYGN